jgi:hypothetical protein
MRLYHNLTRPKQGVRLHLSFNSKSCLQVVAIDEPGLLLEVDLGLESVSFRSREHAIQQEAAGHDRQGPPAAASRSM